MAEKEPAVVTVTEPDEMVFTKAAVVAIMKAPPIVTITEPVVVAEAAIITITEPAIIAITVSVSAAVMVAALMAPFSSIIIAGLRRRQRGAGRNQGSTNQKSLDSIHSILPCYARPDSHSDRLCRVGGLPASCNG
jgi:hypothetical protein